LKSDKDNDELLKLKIDLEEVIKLTQDLITETSDKEKESSQPAKSQKKYEFVAYAGTTTDKMIIPKQIRWKTGEKCMAVWKDGK
jgi:survival-of-motor-neuron-related-splicing factor 30